MGSQRRLSRAWVPFAQQDGEHGQQLVDIETQIEMLLCGNNKWPNKWQCYYYTHTMRVSVRFNGKVFEVCVEGDETVEQLCNKIEHSTGVLARCVIHAPRIPIACVSTHHHSNQKLISKGKTLTASSTRISATNLKDNCSIMLMASATTGTETQVI